jgi:hypothetical protein
MSYHKGVDSGPILSRHKVVESAPRTRQPSPRLVGRDNNDGPESGVRGGGCLPCHGRGPFDSRLLHNPIEGWQRGLVMNTVAEAPTVWDQLSAPDNLDDLVMLIEDAKDCNMFYGMVGPPRAYFEIPLPDGGSLRVVYSIVAFIMRGDHKTAPQRLCKRMWDVFVRIRKHMHQQYPDMQPVVFWRKVPELEIGGTATRIYFRFAVPGCDLQRLCVNEDGVYHDHERDGYQEVLE